MIDAAIVGGHGSNHAVQFLPLLFLGKKLFLKLQLFLQLLLFRTVFGLRGFHSAPVFLAADDGKLNVCQDHYEPQCAQIPRQHFSEVSPSAGLFGCQIQGFIRRIDLNLNTAVMNFSGMENKSVFVNNHTVVVFLPDSITKQLLVISDFRNLFHETIPVHYQDCQARKPVGGIIDRITNDKTGPAFDQRMRACYRCLFGLDGKTCRRTLLRVFCGFKANGCFVDFQWIGQADHTVGCDVQRTNCVIPLHNMLANARKMIRQMISVFQILVTEGFHDADILIKREFDVRCDRRAVDFCFIQSFPHLPTADKRKCDGSYDQFNHEKFPYR